MRDELMGDNVQIAEVRLQKYLRWRREQRSQGCGGAGPGGRGRARA